MVWEELLIHGVGIACVVLIYLRLRHLSRFDVMYWAYTRTPIGKIFHGKQIAVSHAKPTHSNGELHDCGSFSVLEVPLLSDNWCYMLVDHESASVAAVDPCDAERVIDELKALTRRWRAMHGRDLVLRAVLTTHKHLDHAGGNDALAAHFGATLRVVGARDELVQACNHPLDDGDVFTLGATTVTGLLTPCHTPGHMCFLIESKVCNQAPVLFTGDTLFVGGCGRFFEGNAEQMQHNLGTTIASLPGSCRLFCGHEYTLDNLQFASWLEPSNKHISAKLRWAEAQRQQGKSTMPSTVEEELKINPFMRCTRDEVASAVQHAWSTFSPHDSAPLKHRDTEESTLLSASQIMHRLRALKDNNAHNKPETSGRSINKEKRHE